MNTTEQQSVPQPKQIPIRDIVINNDSLAVNIMAFMLQLAHGRGAYTLEESAKIHECIKFLERTSLNQPNIPPTPTYEGAMLPESLPTINEYENNNDEGEKGSTTNNVTLEVNETN